MNIFKLMFQIFRRMPEKPQVLPSPKPAKRKKVPARHYRASKAVRMARKRQRLARKITRRNKNKGIKT